MNTLLFIETLKVHNGKFIQLQRHIRRMEQTIHETFGVYCTFELPDNLIPMKYRQGTIKCRIEYGTEIRKIEFIPYTPRPIGSLKIVEGDRIDYHLKYADRSSLIRLLDLKVGCDDVLITRDGQITDTSYSNVALFDGCGYVTPSTFLLNGTKRQSLIAQGILKVKDIPVKELSQYRTLHLINAMIGLEDGISIDVSMIKP